MIKAVIFDFDGIIADTEELHFTCLKDILYQEEIFINRQTYDEIYLALDDKNCFKRAFATAKSKELSHQEIEELVKRKANLLQSNLTEVKLFSGTSEWIKNTHQKFYLVYAQAHSTGKLHKFLANTLCWNTLQLLSRLKMLSKVSHHQKATCWLCNGCRKYQADTSPPPSALSSRIQ